ncbi:hypothetical protein FCM30_18475 [Lelliottia aquatilis]|uniref:toxin co-regulated pilus biosynthesis Q family protein n=1 Tax=Lelliottia aquatilis TaxID=2080838 RepID=UPI0015765D10|nr:toxin co-regulated pilus biosynthesis Q family protein [Lelliottia aquatilis]NTZ47728.1 hypothetical protein [Lelliottia aquatilis]
MQRTYLSCAGMLCAFFAHAEPVRTDAHAVMRDNTIIINSQLNGYIPDPVTPSPRPAAPASVSLPVPPQGGKSLVTPVTGPASGMVGKNPFHGTPTVPLQSSMASTGTPVSPVLVRAPGPVMSSQWHAQKGSTLKDTLMEWTQTSRCRGADWIVIWSTPVNYPIDAPLQFSGDFHTAIAALFTLYKTADKPLYVRGNEQQCVIKVTDRMAG